LIEIKDTKESRATRKKGQRIIESLINKKITKNPVATRNRVSNNS